MNITINTIYDLNTYFDGVDTDCLLQLYYLLDQYNQLYIDPITGELVGNGTRLGIYTDYFDHNF